MQGGTKLSIGIAQPQLGEEEIAEVSRVIRSGMIANGPETKLFEEEFASFIGCKYACAANNGTAALSLALLACGIGPGDEVITVSHTATGTVAAIANTGAIPVFVDINIDTNNIKIDCIMLQKMIFLYNALDKGWTVKKRKMLIFLQKITKVRKKYY